MIKNALVWSLIVFATAGNNLRAQVTTTAVPFVLIAPDSRNAGMGEAGVGMADDVWAIHWNSAGYAFQTGSELGFSHVNWLPQFGFSDLWIAHAAYKLPVQELDGTIAVGLTYLNLGEITRTATSGPEPIGSYKAYEFAIAVGYATRITENVGFGISMKLIRSALAEDAGAGSATGSYEPGAGAATGFAFDVGILYKPQSFQIPFTSIDFGNALSFGASLSNIGPKLTYIDRAQADPLPLNLRLGLAAKVLESEINNITVITDFTRLLVHRDSTKADEFYKGIFSTWTGGTTSDQLKQFNVGMGIEYWYGAPKLLALRWGFFYEDPNAGNRKFMTFGAGLRFDIYGFDFSYISALEAQHPLGETLRFSASIGLGGN
jgi:hypothetical protein